MEPRFDEVREAASNVVDALRDSRLTIFLRHTMIIASVHVLNRGVATPLTSHDRLWNVLKVAMTSPLLW